MHWKLPDDSPPRRSLVGPAVVASCIPGATLTKAGANGVYQGTMRVKFGPTVAQFRGDACACAGPPTAAAKASSRPSVEPSTVINLRMPQLLQQGRLCNLIENRSTRNGEDVKRDRGFESISLQQRVRNEPYN